MSRCCQPGTDPCIRVLFETKEEIMDILHGQSSSGGVEQPAVPRMPWIDSTFNPKTGFRVLRHNVVHALSLLYVQLSLASTPCVHNKLLFRARSGAGTAPDMSVRQRKMESRRSPARLLSCSPVASSTYFGDGTDGGGANTGRADSSLVRSSSSPLGRAIVRCYRRCPCPCPRRRPRRRRRWKRRSVVSTHGSSPVALGQRLHEACEQVLPPCWLKDGGPASGRASLAIFSPASCPCGAGEALSALHLSRRRLSALPRPHEVDEPRRLHTVVRSRNGTLLACGGVG